MKLTEKDYAFLDRLYQNDLYKRAKHFNLSTSQVATVFPGAFMCYGPLVNNGYGCCYNPTKNQITFGVSAFRINNGNTSVPRFIDELSNSLNILQEISLQQSSKI